MGCALGMYSKTRCAKIIQTEIARKQRGTACNGTKRPSHVLTANGGGYLSMLVYTNQMAGLKTYGC